MSVWWRDDLVRMQKIVRNAFEREGGNHLQQLGADLGFGPRTATAVAFLTALEREHDGGGRAAQPVSCERSVTMNELARRFSLTSFETDVVTLALAVEVEPRFQSILRALSVETNMRAPTVGLALELLSERPLDESWLHLFSPAGALLRHELVELESDGPLPSRTLRLARSLDVATWTTPPSPLARVHERADLASSIANVGAWMNEQRAPLVFCEGVAGSGRDEVARALCNASGRAVIPLSAITPAEHHRAAVRNAIWHDATLLISDVDAAPVWPAIARLVATYDVPVVAVVPPRVDLSLFGGRPVRIFRVPELDTTTRRGIWAALLEGNARAARLDPWALAVRFPVAPSQIAMAWQLASSDGGSEPIELHDLELALHSAAARPVAGIARRLGCPFQLDDLVVGFETRQELELVLAWLRSGPRSRAALAEGIAPPGLICLFDGPPGTGKTMAAQILAREAEVDLYHVDLAQIVSKYVGETEKNLSALFDMLESRRAILFFDEADAIFGRRTATKDAHDRYANIETSYLLQRIDRYEGVIILATNMLGNLDAAFLRRIQVVARFQLPSVDERIQLWKRMLPTTCEDKVDVVALGRTFSMSGADIRNTIVTATVLSTDAGEPLSLSHLVPAACRELRKAGRLIDPGTFGSLRPYLRLPPS